MYLDRTDDTEAKVSALTAPSSKAPLTPWR